MWASPLWEGEYVGVTAGGISCCWDGSLDPRPGSPRFRTLGLPAADRAFIHLQEACQPLTVCVPLNRVGQIFDQRQHLGGNFGFYLGIVQVTPDSQRTHHMDNNGLGIFDQFFPLFRVTLDDLIRVEFVGHGRHAQVGLQAGFVMQQAAGIEANLILAVEGLARRFQPAQDGFLTGGIRVEGQDDAAGETS